MKNTLVIKIIVSHFYPEVNALTNRLESLLPLLLHRHEVKIIYLLQPGHRFERKQTAERFPMQNLALFPVKAKGYNKYGILRRTIGETVNNWRLWRVARRIDADVLFQSVPQLMLLPVSALFVPFQKAPRKIIEIRDLTWEYLNLGKGFFATLLRFMIERVAVYSIKQFNEVITCTEAQAEFVKKHTRCHVVVVRNGIAREKYQQLSSQRWNAPQQRRLRLCYFGTFGHAQNLMVLARAAKLLQEDIGLEFYVVGAGPDELGLRRFVKINKIANFHIVKKVPWKELLKFYSMADVLYAQLRKGDAFATAEPSKLFEYFSTGKRVIYGGEGLGRELAEQFSNVDVIEPDDPVLLASTIRGLQRTKLTRCDTDIERVETYFVRENIFRSYLERAGLS